MVKEAIRKKAFSYLLKKKEGRNSENAKGKNIKYEEFSIAKYELVYCETLLGQYEIVTYIAVYKELYSEDLKDQFDVSRFQMNDSMPAGPCEPWSFLCILLITALD